MRFENVVEKIVKMGGTVWNESGNLLTKLGQLIWGTLGGRSFVIAMSALICGFTLAWRHSLTGDFVALVSGISTLVHTRAVFADYHERRMSQTNQDANNQ